MLKMLRATVVVNVTMLAFAMFLSAGNAYMPVPLVQAAAT